MMVLKSVLAGTFKLDGGAMFGVVPKRIWSKLMQPDANNLCDWVMRCLYVEDRHHRILIDTGMGNKQDTKFFSYYEPGGFRTLQAALNHHLIDPESITDVILTHLHFDHVGGALFYDEAGNPAASLPSATHWTHKEQWDLAVKPNAREKASFLPENFMPLLAQDRIRFLQDGDSPFPSIEFIRVDGHTRAMVLPLIHAGPDKKLLFTADLFPSVHHLALPYIMAYDMQPLVTLAEKELLLNRCIEEKIDLYFEHDIDHEVASLKRTETGKVVAAAFTTLEEWGVKTG
ncbi:MAG TPA: MBL fold metallo-hydrolase [Saprospiraceae bacterium]|nr:MBL fold metallo-hydrolase [Saprospiraceae bacterium]